MFSNVICVSVLPDKGEDSFALRTEGETAFLCVADGCGGMGSRRYEGLDGHTAAYAASRLATETAAASTPEELAQNLDDNFHHFAEKHCPQGGSRIVSTMQHRLPTTLCAAWVHDDQAHFCWAGDSRGYVLDEQGLHQCTRDHVRGNGDAFDNLYRDPPLSRFLTADRPTSLEAHAVRLSKPCMVLMVTDGVYASLPTPMEMKMLLLDTLRQAKSWESWEKKLRSTIAKIAQDDATLLALPMMDGLSFEAFQQRMLIRREALQKGFITQVRRRKTIEYARECWNRYQTDYDWTGEKP